MSATGIYIVSRVDTEFHVDGIGNLRSEILSVHANLNSAIDRAEEEYQKEGAGKMVSSEAGAGFIPENIVWCVARGDGESPYYVEYHKLEA